MIHRALLAAACLVLLALAGPDARADSWGPPQPMLASSEDGRWYVISNPGDDYRTGRLLLVRRAPGKAPRGPLYGSGDVFEQAAPIEPSEGDVVVARADGHMPMDVRCLNGGQGFVLFDTHGGVGTGIVLARYDGEGRRLWTRKLPDLFTPLQIQGFTHTVSSIWWSSGLWIDEAQGAVIVVYELLGPQLLEVDLATGRHQAGDRACLLPRFGRGTFKERLLALDTAARVRPPGLLDAARAGYAVADLPPAIRMRLAVLMAEEGDDSGAEFVLAHVAQGKPKALRTFAVKSLPVLLGEDALPHLRDAMRGEADEAWHAAMQGFQRLGAAAIPTLVEMLGEEGESSDYRGGAASVLGDLALVARPAVPALLDAARTAPEYVANAALNALVEILPPAELGPQLIPLLAGGSGDDGRIALYFGEHPRADAVPALAAARARHAQDENDVCRRWIDEALAACRGR